VIKSFNDDSPDSSETDQKAEKGATPAASPAPAAPADKPAADAAPSSDDGPSAIVALFVGLAMMVGLTIAAPVIMAFGTPISLVFVVFGLWEAWKLSRGVSIEIEGPYRAAVPAMAPSST
jgi:hypothetical protein